jgi:type I restriction enzyme M protein
VVHTTDLAKVRATLWAAADELRANSKLTPVQYRDPVLGLVFLAYAENRFQAVRGEVEARATARNPATIADYKAKSVLYVPDEARLSHLVGLPEGDDIGKAVDEAIKAIEATNPELKDILPRGYQKLERSTLIELLRLFAPLPTQLSGDAFGFIYEDFLSNFAAQEGKGGGEYFTPYSIVRLIVDILHPYAGRVFDPACGSGGMFVQCAKFVERHHESATRKLSIFGAEITDDTVPLAKMNLALHGLSGDVRQANSYYEDPHRAHSAFDFVMANPPFNVDKVKKEQLAGDKRFPFGMPRSQRELLVDTAVLRRSKRPRSRRVRHGQLRGGRGPLGEGDPQAARRVRSGRRDGRDQLQLLLHRHLARHAVVPRQGQSRYAA